MSNSSLVSYTMISPCRTSPRNHKIDTITIHCVVGQLSVEGICGCFRNSAVGASCNYAIGADGRIGLCVEEKDRSWCSSSPSNDHRAITIECASDSAHPYAINNKVYQSLLKLCADICRRNGIKELKWKADKSLVGQVDKQNLTVHRWFANKSCPGDYIYNRLGQIAKEVTTKIQNGTGVTGYTKIAGRSRATVEQMRKYIKEKNPKVPKSVLKMIPLYLSEGEAEGIRGDIAFAQSCLETGNFTFKGSAVTLDQNNFCGMGVTAVGMKGNSFKNPKTGIRAQIQHLKAYANAEALRNPCVDSRFQYVERGVAKYVEYLGIQENPKGKGWAGGKDYGAKILDILDKILDIEKEETGMAIKINKKLIKRNQTPMKRSKADIKYIVIHYVGALGGALDNVNFYAGGNRNASADFFVGHNGEIYQAVDYYNAYSWHCGGGLQGAGGASFYGKCTNKNSIGIEMCVKKRSTATMNAADRDWYFTDQTYQSTVQLVRQLMKELNIDVSHVIRHYDVNGKTCPNPFVYNTGSYTWAGFKAAVKGGNTANTEENYMFGIRPVKKGEKGNHVLLVQEILRAREINGKDGKPLKLDKHCDTNTVFAIKQYQKAREKVEPGICGGVDGVAGPKTLKDMIAL